MSLELEPLSTRWLGDNKHFVRMLRSSVAETKKAVAQINREIAKIKSLPAGKGFGGGGLGAGGAFVPGARGKGGRGGRGAAMGFMADSLGGSMGLSMGGTAEVVGGIYDFIKASPKATAEMVKFGKSAWNVRNTLSILAKTGGWGKSSLVSFGATAGRVALTIGGIGTAAVGATAGIVYLFESWSTESKKAAEWAAQANKNTEKWLANFSGINSDRADAISDKRRFGGTDEQQIADLKRFHEDVARTAEKAETAMYSFGAQVEDSKKSWLGWAGIDFGLQEVGAKQAEGAKREFEAANQQAHALARQIELAEKELALKKKLEEQAKKERYSGMMGSTLGGLRGAGGRLGLDLQGERSGWSAGKLAEEHAVFDLRLKMTDAGLKLSKADEDRVRAIVRQNEALRAQQQEIEKQKKQQLEMVEAMAERDEKFRSLQESMAAEAADLLNAQLSDIGKLKEEIARVNELVANGALSQDQAGGIIGKMKKEFAERFRGGETDGSAGAAVQGGSMEAYSLTKFGKHERRIDVNIEKMLQESKEQTSTQQELLQQMRGNSMQQAFEYVGIG